MVRRRHGDADLVEVVALEEATGEVLEDGMDPPTTPLMGVPIT